MRPTALTSARALSRTIGLLAVGVGVFTSPLSAAEQPARGAGPPIVRTAQGGAWSAPATWEGGKVPSGDVRVLIRQGHHVVYDVQAKGPIRSLTISGALSFARDRDTRLDVGLIKIQAG